MNLERCDKGHFYDADKFAACPHCEASNIEVQATAPYEDLPTEMIQTVPMPEDKQDDSLKSKINSAIANNAMKRVQAQPQPEQAVSDDQKTVSFYSMKAGAANVEPTVGILLCVEGASFGSTYLLKAGRNFIGRSNSMDVVIAGDNSVSREKHAIVVYDPKSKRFIAQPGGSSELFYVNDQVVLDVLELKEYDEILVGNTKLVFVPICGEKFSWENYQK